jgi:hypothetical protein
MESPKDDWMFVLTGDALRTEIKRREAMHERLRNAAQYACDKWLADESIKHAMYGLRDLLESS